MLVVAGESLVDLLVDEAGVVVPRLGGGPYNVARGLARLGVPCALLTALSTDRFGAMLRQGLVEDGVDDRCVVETDRPTTLAIAHLTAGVARYGFYAAGTAAPSLTAMDVAAVAPDEIDVLHVGTLGLAFDPMASALEHLVASVPARTTVMVDPNVRRDVLADEPSYRPRLERVLERADVVKVSTEDLESLWPDTPAALAAQGLLSHHTKSVLVTAGAERIEILTAAGVARVPTVPVRVVDTVGAGDAFCAGFLSRWQHEGRAQSDLADVGALRSAVSFAALVAGITCQRVGADPPRLGDLPSAPLLST